MPPELIIKFMEEMSPSDLENFIRAHKRLWKIFEEGADRDSLMARVLKNQPEFETILYIYTAQHNENHPDRMLHPRTINLALGRGRKLTLMHGVSANRRRNRNKTRTQHPLDITVGIYDLARLWKMTTIVDWWVAIYPMLRWREAPEERRCLRPNEEARLRKAVARWWLYAFHHHTRFRRNSRAPEMWSFDTRLYHLRIMSTTEIRELEDVWELLFDAVSRDLCSSVELHGLVPDLVPWGHGEGRHNKIVETYLKLDPCQLRQILTAFSGGFQKEAIVMHASASIGHFPADRETLSTSIHKVLRERVLARGIHDVGQLPRMGIVDEDRDDEQSLARWIDDAWPDGFAPLSAEKLSTFPLEPLAMVPRGDDGSDENLPW
ncbi:hypothetical protein GGS23DRAFT_601667 [Durotheca rogersii]|uniref:uncharacterized protein n=1 Tax=Durotheca rogersii TaxID=419775 RepID=UPI00221FB2B0|nr:uncharacterized protein GGS23DRAFT_601667 [Durotheca rogersii]KAI5854079.1 hypothetical protein GGS23DRAFT_601667 [Durotheca rogersii]